MAANQFDGKCESCGGLVKAQEGVVVGKRDQGWIVSHKCAHALQKPQIDAAMVKRAIEASSSLEAGAAGTPTPEERMEAALRAAFNAP